MKDNASKTSLPSHWGEACEWAKDYCRKMFHKEWHDDSIAHEYMAARNGYLAACERRSADETAGSTGVSLAVEETKTRLEEAWKQLPVKTACRDPGWDYDKERGMVCKGCNRSATDILTVEVENQTPTARFERAEALIEVLNVMDRLEAMPAKELVDLALQHIELTGRQEQIFVELCSRVHPSWPNEVKERTPAE